MFFFQKLNNPNLVKFAISSKKCLWQINDFSSKFRVPKKINKTPSQLQDIFSFPSVNMPWFELKECLQKVQNWMKYRFYPLFHFSHKSITFGNKKSFFLRKITMLNAFYAKFGKRIGEIFFAFTFASWCDWQNWFEKPWYWRIVRPS